uniref:Uncharacterized protein n=1 Tax=Oryza sativa subsp. japonica TaxID=39947 RepID=Q6L4Q6_ORYSJ|nr:hypothetical protein [Oryza sativa Japonica Group]
MAAVRHASRGKFCQFQKVERWLSSLHGGEMESQKPLENHLCHLMPGRSSSYYRRSEAVAINARITNIGGRHTPS